jgi:glutaconate CoA-transferase subunit B
MSAIPGSQAECTSEDAMIVAGSRLLADGQVCFVGVGLPSAAAILALRTHAPNLVLVYESGTLGTRPAYLPLSVADHVLSSTAQTIVSVPEIFNYWVQPGRIDVGVLGAAQVDRFANLNSTVVGDYARPKVRLPGAGGAPEIAAGCRSIIVLIRQSQRTFVNAVDFVTSLGHGSGRNERAALDFPGAGPRAVVTDIGLYEPDPATGELVLTRLHPGATVDGARAATGWTLAVASDLGPIAQPTAHELSVLRELQSAREDCHA